MLFCQFPVLFPQTMQPECQPDQTYVEDYGSMSNDAWNQGVSGAFVIRIGVGQEIPTGFTCLNTIFSGQGERIGTVELAECNDWPGK